MPCSCANKSRNKYVPRSDASDEYDHLLQNCPRSNYSGRSSQKYENSSVLDDQAWNALSSLRQKACRFITSETEETPTELLATECQYSHVSGYGGAEALITANDLIDYRPQSEFLRKMKQKCQLLCSSMADICSSLNESFRNDSYDYQMSNESPRMGENPYNSQACGRVRFTEQGMDGGDEQMLYENPSYDHHCSTDEKLLDGLIDRRLPSSQNLGRPKSANKKSQHISRSKKPSSKCRGRRKRKSGSPEKCESENQFEPTLKKPHENSCERCWRYASPARSPVNKPDQKYDPNFRRGHSCYDFEGGDAEFYDIRISPCKNLQPITSREKQQSPETLPANTLEARQLSSSKRRTPDERRSRSLGSQRSPASQPQAFTPPRDRSPEPQPRTFTSKYRQTPGPQSQSFSSSYHQSPDSPPQRSVSIWHKSPETQPQTNTTGRQKSPESQPQSFSSSYHQSPDPQSQTYTLCQESPETPPQRSVSIWHKSPEAQSQMYNSIRQKTPETQPQSFSPMYHQTPGPQPQTFSSLCHQSPDSPPQRSISIWHKSPETEPQTYTTGRQKTPEPQPQSFSSSYHQSPDPQSRTFNLYQKSPETPPQRSISIWHKSPEAQPQMYNSIRQKTPDPQPQSFSSTCYRPPGPQPQSFSSSYRQSPDSPPQRSTSIWHKSPEVQPQTYTTVRQRTPEPQTPSFSPTCHQTSGPQPQSFSSSYRQSPDSPPQRSVSIWHKSPETQPQSYTTGRQRTPEPQTPSFSSTYHQSPESPPQRSVSIWHKSPVRQPSRTNIRRQEPSEVQQRQIPHQRPQAQRSQSPATPRENDYCYQSMRSPERGIPRPQSLTPPSPSPGPQGIFYPEAVQRPRPNGGIPGDIYSTDLKRYSNGIDDFDVSEYKTICPPQRQEFLEPVNNSLPDRQLEPSQPSAGGKVYSPRHPTPKPGPVGLGTIPEAVNFEACRCKTSKKQNSSPKSLKEKSSRSPARPGTSKKDSVRQSNSTSSSNRRSKSPNKSSSRSPPNKAKGSSPNKARGSSPNKARGGSPSKGSKSPNRSGNGSARKCKPKSLSPKAESSTQEVRKSPQKSPQVKPDAKKTRSLDDVNNRTPRSPGQRPQSSDPRGEVSPRKIESPDQYQGLDHHIRSCSCDAHDSFPVEMNSKHVICCHCDWENHPTVAYKASESKRLNSSYKGFDGRTFECPHQKARNLSADQPPGSVNSSFERDCRLLSELQNTPSFQSTFQGTSPTPSSPRKYFMFYMTKCKENKGDDDVEVLVEELTQACPSKTDSRTKDLTDKMKKIMECPSDSMALKFQKGVSDQYKTPQSSRVLYF